MDNTVDDAELVAVERGINARLETEASVHAMTKAHVLPKLIAMVNAQQDVAPRDAALIDADMQHLQLLRKGNGGVELTGAMFEKDNGEMPMQGARGLQAIHAQIERRKLRAELTLNDQSVPFNEGSIKLSTVATLFIPVQTLRALGIEMPKLSQAELVALRGAENGQQTAL